MSAPPIPRGESLVSNALARNRLGPFSVGSSIASAVAPLTVTAVVISFALAVTGLLGVPLAMLAGAALLLLFSVGYLAMARHIENPGAFYAYIAQGIGRPIGVAVSWIALVVYPCFLLGCFGGFGALVTPLVNSVLPFDVPWYLPSIAVWVLVAVLGAAEIGMSEKVMVILVVTETLLVAAYTTAIMLGPGFSFSSAPVSTGNLSGPTVGVLLVIAMTSFAGVEQSAVYSEEARDRRRTIPIATVATIVIVALLYFATSWVQISAGGPQIIDRATKEGGDLFFNQAAVVLGDTAVTGGRILLGTSLIAAMLAFHNATSRYAYALGREGVLVRGLGKTTIKGAPRNASLTLSAVTLLVLVVYAIAGWDPMLHLFYLGTTTGGLGVLLLITLTSIAVICYFARDARSENLWRRRVAPLLATALLLVVSYLALDNLPTLYGVPAGTGPALVVPVAFLLIFAAGTGWGLILKHTKPQVYEGIGRGTHSATATASSLPATL